MNTDEFNALINELIAGLPAPMVITRLSLLVYALVEMGGTPAEDALRMLVRLRRRDFFPDK